ncbi:propionyl-CoA carboxylase, partial [Aureobasidium melanogenum]
MGDSGDNPTKSHQDGHSQPAESNKAASRLSQLSAQINPPPPTQRKRKSKAKNALPADYSDLMAQMATMRTITSTPPANSKGYIRQKASGKLWARERINLFLDKDTFREVGAVSGTTSWKTSPTNALQESVEGFVPSNNPQGFGQVTCPISKQHRRVYITADDYAIRAGHADGSSHHKTLYGEETALKLKIPVVKLVDGSSGGGSVTTIKQQGWSYLPPLTHFPAVIKQLDAGIPNLGAVVGPAIGLGAARVVSTHFSVMAADVGSLFNAGPDVVAQATFEEGLTLQDLGGPDVHCRNGTIDNLAPNEAAAFEQLKTILGFLPDCGDLQAPPVLPDDWSGDTVKREDINLRSIIPRKQGRMYNPYTIITSVVDKASFFEIGRLWGTTAITGLARLGGRPVGIISNNCESSTGGALDPLGSQKLTRMLKFCDVFNLPIVQFVDIPGYAIGTAAERGATMKWGVELAKAYYASTTPIFSVVTRRCYGIAGGVMIDSRSPRAVVAWPSGEWGSLPLEGGIQVAHRAELAAIAKKEGEEAMKKKYAELDTEYRRLMNPVRAANAFGVEQIIDPKDTRSVVCGWVKDMYGLVMVERLEDRKARRIVPTFT